MTDKPITYEEWLAVMATRIGKPPSKAAPIARYGDPAKTLRFESERKKREK